VNPGRGARPVFAAAWIAIPGGVLLLLLRGAGPLGDLDPAVVTQGLQVTLALYGFPFVALGDARSAAGPAASAALLGVPLTILARRLSGEAPFGVAVALPPLALFAAATFFRPHRRGIGEWTAAVTALGFGLPGLHLLATDLGAGAPFPIGVLSPIVPPGGGAPAAALLLAAGLAAIVLPAGKPRSAEHP